MADKYKEAVLQVAVQNSSGGPKLTQQLNYTSSGQSTTLHYDNYGCGLGRIGFGFGSLNLTLTLTGQHLHNVTPCSDTLLS